MSGDVMHNTFDDGRVYQARIVDQMLAKSAQDETRIILTVKLEAALKNEKNPADGTDPCPQLEREVWITLVEHDEDRLGMAIRDLERLGFTDDDISRLHPDHPDAFSLVGKDVHVRCRIKDDLEYFNLAWPRVKATPVSIADLQQSTGSLATAVAAARKKLKEDGARRKKEKSKHASGTSPSDVGF